MPKTGETITVHFALGPVRGRFSFKCPPPGQWIPDDMLHDLWQPVEGNLDGGTHQHEFDLELIHDTVHSTPGAEGVSMAAVHGFEYRGNGHNHLFALGDFSTTALIDEVTRRRNFSGLIVRDGDKPEVKPGIRLKGDDAADLLRSALEQME